MSVLVSTTKGNLLVHLRFSDCPKASFNFLALCGSSYYDGCQFHRCVPNAFVLTGDPTGTGKGGESAFAQRYFDDEGFGSVSHGTRGVLSMAHKGHKPDTNASQFFILFEPYSALDDKHTAFGFVDLEWNDGECEKTLKRLEELPVDEKYNVLEKEAKIIEATVLYNPFAEGLLKLESLLSIKNVAQKTFSILSHSSLLDGDICTSLSKQMVMEASLGKGTESKVGENMPVERKRQRDEPFVADYRPYGGQQLSIILERRSAHKDHWDRYYRNNTVNGYRDRHYILREFHELRDALVELKTNKISTVEKDVVWMEVGCGVGNAFLPILEEFGMVPGWKIVAFDISSVAIDLLTKKRQSLPKELQDKLFVKVLNPVLESIIDSPKVNTFSSVSSCDPSLSGIRVSEDSIDFVSMIFVLCSIQKDKHELVLRRVAQCMKPGAIFFFREYCVDDHAATRFGNGRKIAEHTYVRTNGTLSHFFGLEEVRKLFLSAGLKALELFEVDREVINRKESLNMHRKFIQGRFIKVSQGVGQ